MARNAADATSFVTTVTPKEALGHRRLNRWRTIWTSFVDLHEAVAGVLRRDLLQ